MRTQIPHFRLPESVIDEETGYVLDLGVEVPNPARRIDSMAALLERRTTTPSSSAAARRAAATSTCRAARKRRPEHPHRHRLAQRRSRSATSPAWASRVIVLGGGNTAMDCCRSARRLGGTRGDGDRAQRLCRDEGLAVGKGRRACTRASRSSISTCPGTFEHEGRQAHGDDLRARRRAEYDAAGQAAQLVPTGAAGRVRRPATTVLVAVGQENAFPWIERDQRHRVRQAMGPAASWTPETFQATLAHVFFGGDAAFGPKNIISAVAHGHQAAVSIDQASCTARTVLRCGRRP